jgi:hypothetical protein
VLAAPAGPANKTFVHRKKTFIQQDQSQKLFQNHKLLVDVNRQRNDLSAIQTLHLNTLPI